MTIEESFEEKYKPASFLRRILALFYDTLLLTGIILGYLLVVTLMFGDTFESISERIFLQFSYLILGVIFFTYFWKVNKGQTLGMQVWKIRIVGDKNKEPSTKNLIYRSLFGLVFNLAFGSNYLFIFFNKDKKSINDLLSKTKTIKIN
jgi:uncharacterized RDD family membrane protein YckC